MSETLPIDEIFESISRMLGFNYIDIKSFRVVKRDDTSYLLLVLMERARLNEMYVMMSEMINSETYSNMNFRSLYDIILVELTENIITSIIYLGTTANVTNNISDMKTSLDYIESLVNNSFRNSNIVTRRLIQEPTSRILYYATIKAYPDRLVNITEAIVIGVIDKYFLTYIGDAVTVVYTPVYIIRVKDRVVLVQPKVPLDFREYSSSYNIIENIEVDENKLNIAISRNDMLSYNIIVL